ncbi:MAG: DUF885 family protein [Vicinamibacteria bacterium]
MKGSVLSMFALALFGSSAPLEAQGGYSELVGLDAEFLEFKKAKLVDGVPDLGSAEIERRRRGLEDFQKRLRAIDTSSWSVPQKVDYLLAWAKVNTVVFDHRVMKPWARDPLVYLDLVSETPYAELPAPPEKKAELVSSLGAVPRIMEQAQASLTEANGELAKLAIFYLENFDGVAQGEPYRDQPPAGTIGWYEDLCGRLRQHHGEMVSDCQAALKAVQGYRDWLRANVDRMPQSAAIGMDNFNWYLKHVRLLPYTSDDLMLLGEREFHRYRLDYLVERNKNQKLPELELTKTREQHEERTREAEEQIRSLVAAQNLLTIPDDIPSEYETDVFWSPRAETKRHFWEELQFRNALNNHVHASIPGHRFDGTLRQRLTNPIRKTYRDTERGEGWATYLEETLVQAGLTDENPRAKELFYVALIKRGSRVFAETGMHSGRMSLDQANEFMIDWVPFMEENLGRYDLVGYLRRPGAGSAYLVGKIQIEKLLSERAFQLGDDFDLGKFHDEFLSKGIIPVTLIRWEMTGHDDEVKKLWDDVVGVSASQN